MTRRNEAAVHARSRIRLVAGVSVNITRNGVAVLSAVTITKVAADRMVTAEGLFLLDQDEHAWLMGLDVVPDELRIGDQIEYGGQSFQLCESSTTQKHWHWSDLEQTGRTYISRMI